ncbi:MAG TPA: PP2C family serine/threonine-protein phosphatase [Labilithrix sp.]|nr:PP2C family serine/threonine-protein phosphatase [Labilithrix sp.]
MAENALPIAIAAAVLFFAVYLLAWWMRERSIARRAARQTAPAPVAVAAPAARAATVAKAKATSAPKAVPVAAESGPSMVRIDYEEDAENEPTKVGEPRKARTSVAPPTQKIMYDEDAAVDEPTHSGALILVTATAQTDKGLRRKRNEDSVLAREEEGIFVVADGMGGYRGGEIASKLAVSTIERAFVTKTFDGPLDDAIPRRASELVRAIQMANEAILERAEADDQLTGMGTTICAARFSANKQRLYVGHVGDSRVYIFRNGKLRQMTSDHTMKDLGVVGEGAAHLSRAVGVWPVVPIDVVFGKPQPGDLYVLCSDGLTKMVSDEDIRSVLATSAAPSVVAEALVKAANDHGGKDNVSVIVVRVDDPATSDRPGVAA